MRPRSIPMPILMTPQWPLVVTASMFQLPSTVAAVAGGTEQKTANAVARAKTHKRLAIMGVLILVVLHGMELSWRSPGSLKSRGTFPRKHYRIIAETGAPRRSRQADRTNQRIGGG